MEGLAQYVSIRSVIGKVIGKLQLTDVSGTISQMADWAVDAEYKIGSRNSFQRIECEIDVENYRACVPSGFVRLLAIKKGDHVLDVTNKDFRQFNKGVSFPKPIDESKFNNGNKVLYNPGQPNVWQVNFVPIFQIGDVINIAITNDDCGDATINQFMYVVQGGDDINSIIQAFIAQINGIGNLPYTAVPDSSFFQIIAVNNLINLQVVVQTTSITGGVTTQLISRRIMPTTPNVHEGNCDINIATGSENLANRNAALLNDGMYSAGSHGNENGFYGDGISGSPNTSKFSLDNDHLHFNAIQSGKVGIAYWGIKTDEEGWPMIHSTHADAVAQYIMWQYNIANWIGGKIATGVMDRLERRWYTLCAQARGDDEMPNSQEMRYLANLNMQLIPLPNKNLF